ncbi:MAG: hypothetical protein ACRDD8_03230 [Bacteroidales bacterium]
MIDNQTLCALLEIRDQRIKTVGLKAAINNRIKDRDLSFPAG